MKYLLYLHENRLKKFPLDQEVVTIGWSRRNSLTIKEDFVSNFHLKIETHEDHIKIFDLDSTNGTYIGGGKIKEGKISFNESFMLGKIEFILKEGSLSDFIPAEELVPVFKTMMRDHESAYLDRQTRYIKNIYQEILKQVMKTGLKASSIHDLLMELNKYLSNLTDIGSLFLIQKELDDINLLVSIKEIVEEFSLINKIIKTYPEIWHENRIEKPLKMNDYFIHSIPVTLMGNTSVLVYLSKDKIGDKLKEFLITLAKEISILAMIITDKEATSIPVKSVKEATSQSIVAGNAYMKDLVKQAERIAKSDLFVLIQGESGTGKELFARLIHENSRRKNHNLVALNCAAIPENLLESELFGYEKGAFTGAYGNKIGKLKLADKGTLVLDEIGDMPITMQAKLLRVLQEKSFYPVGSITPVTVDLRIIFLTNKNLNKMIEDQKFRTDLYYRIKQYTINIPPLRERREDISILINHFTRIFSKKISRHIKGFSLRARRALLNYPWPGNVRELENEINKLVNVAEENELIGYELLSEEIKQNPDQSAGLNTKISKKELEIKNIRQLLNQNSWNKSKTARELGMTYRGLHKKMLRLGIERKNG